MKELQVIDHVFDDMCSFLFLYKSYRNARKCKRYRTDVLDFTKDLEVNLRKLNEELLSGIYNVGPYHIFYVYEPKLRMVMSIQFRDRVVQWSIYSVLYSFYDRLFIEDSYACRINKGSHKAIARLQYWLQYLSRKPKRWYYLKLDISKYFYKVDHQILINILSRRVKDERLLDLLIKIINNKDTKFGLPDDIDSIDEYILDKMVFDRGMPIGNLTSQLFANIYLNELDQYCKHILKIHYYIRYMDDIIILGDSPKQLLELKNKIEYYLNTELHLSLNNKTNIGDISSGINFVGLRIFNNYTKLRRSTAKRIRRSVKHVIENYTAGIITKEELFAVLNSYKGIIDHYNCYGLNKYLARVCKIITEGVMNMDESIKFSESATVIKYNNNDNNELKEDNVMNKDGAKWKCSARIEKYNTEDSIKSGIPDEVVPVNGNTALYTGLSLLWNLVSGLGDNNKYYFLNEQNTFIGVGNSSATANPDQSGLLGTAKYYKEMDQTTGVNYPIIEDNTITVRAKFGPNEANFAWNEWGVLNGNPNNPGNRDIETIVQMNRKVEAMGTKVTGSTWVLVADISINP